jgi:ABC-type lipoprotein release transport system permease subunit
MFPSTSNKRMLLRRVGCQEAKTVTFNLIVSRWRRRCAGVPTAIGAGYLIASQLFGVKPWDPWMLSGAALLLGLAALTAALVPARRAAGVDPMQALRSE